MRIDSAVLVPILFAASFAASASASTPYCFGTACPCANNDPTGTGGCLHSTSPVLGPGAVMSSTGSETVVGDTVVLHIVGMPASTAVLFYQGTTSVSVPFGDGLRCVGGSAIRLGIKFAVAGAADFGHGVGTDPDVSVRGQIPAAGGTRFYQGWYRDPLGFCTPATFNLTNGLQIVWT